jgi:acetolactate synthase-1/2/3 large subunit
VTFRALDQEVPVVDAIVDVLEEAEVRYVLGMSGGYVGQIFAALAGHHTIRSIQVRQEAIASTMSEAYGRMTGTPIVLMGQGEWIVGNAGQGLLEALLGCSPVVVLTELSDGAALSHHGVYQSGTGDYGAWDTREALRAVTKRVMVSHYGAQAVQQTQLAFKHASTGEAGPVAVVFHSESLRGTVGPESSPRIYATGPYLASPSRAVDEEALARAHQALHVAQLPVVVAGNGVRVARAKAQLLGLSAEADLPVATTSGGKGVFPETDPRALGVIGPYGSRIANSIVGAADVVLAVGTKLGPTDTGNGHPDLIDPSRQILIHIDAEPLNAGWTFPTDHVLVGDARHLLDRLRRASSEAGPPSRTTTACARREAASGPAEPAAHSTSEMPLHPRHVVDALQQSVPDDVVVTADAGENRLFMMHWFKTPARGEYLQPAGGGGMGYAIPAALGARLAAPDLPVVAVCGDGGFSMTMHALMTAVHEHIGIGVVVFNNGALGWSMHGSGGRVGADFGEFDLAAIASAMGCDAVRVAQPDALPAALEACVVARDRPFVVDVPTSTEVSFKSVRVLRPHRDRPVSSRREGNSR